MVKVFISWSTHRSEIFAAKLRDWLPQVLQFVEPFVSSEDIAKGARWSNIVRTNLQEAGFGIICVTAENISRPWLNFEGGALGNRFDEARVCPILLDHHKEQIEGPLAQFQLATVEKAEMLRVVLSINDCAEPPLRKELVYASFNKWWDDFETALRAIPAVSEPVVQRKQESILTEILDLVRAQARFVTRVNLDVDPSINNFNIYAKDGKTYHWNIGSIVRHSDYGEGVIAGFLRNHRGNPDLFAVDYRSGRRFHELDDDALEVVLEDQ